MSLAHVQSIIQRHWGYDSLRPLQAEAMRSVLDGRDSVVVLPTGGGKSLCFQAPAMAVEGLAVVVSPLISLMKDQVDALREIGLPAACVNSTIAPHDRRETRDEVLAGRLKLLYLSPERLMTQQTLEFLKRAKLAFFAIDEAHCISDWGHDFRPEYRMLKRLKKEFPGVALHGYTATATGRVRNDIARELALNAPEILVGSFDRPNLVYRVIRRDNRLRQIAEVVDRHPNESGIIYCIRRRDVDEVCAALTAAGASALPYHAGMEDRHRKENQEAFIREQCRIIVATVAFGMGIDKSNVRFVVHAGAPKSLEAYQQESGRAGRDGLEAECVLLHSSGDFHIWKRLLDDLPSEAKTAAHALLAGMERFCATARCRHAAIVEYFGQYLATDNCGACDACLGERTVVNDSLIVAQKVLSCVARVKENFGADYVAKVLTGSQEQRILDNGHDQLSTYGLMGDLSLRVVRAYVEQLVELGDLRRTGDFNVLALTEQGRETLRGQRTPRLFEPDIKEKKPAKVAAESWEGVDRDLFEELRQLRREMADEKGLPPFVVFGDATLRDLARRRPSTAAALLSIHGIGEKKATQYGERFLAAIDEYCDRQETATRDVGIDATGTETRSTGLRARSVSKGRGTGSVSERIKPLTETK